MPMPMPMPVPGSRTRLTHDLRLQLLPQPLIHLRLLVVHPTSLLTLHQLICQRARRRLRIITLIIIATQDHPVPTMILLRISRMLR